MKKHLTGLFILIAITSIISACNERAEDGGYIQEITKSRITKDSFYRVDDNSPLGKDATFEHLNYFEPSKDWMISCDFTSRTDTIIIVLDTKGFAREYLVYGILNGKCPTGVFELFAFKKEGEPYLFVPFMDATGRNNKSYSGGRFIECQYPDENMKVLLDFNQAYNSYCHYNHDYNCPIVPEQNRLAIEILAGEKAYKIEK